MKPKLGVMDPSCARANNIWQSVSPRAQIVMQSHARCPAVMPAPTLARHGNEGNFFVAGEIESCDALVVRLWPMASGGRFCQVPLVVPAPPLVKVGGANSFLGDIGGLVNFVCGYDGTLGFNSKRRQNGFGWLMEAD